MEAGQNDTVTPEPTDDEAPVTEADAAPPTALEILGPAGPLVALLDGVLAHLGQQRLVEARKQRVRQTLEDLRGGLIDLGERLQAAEETGARMERDAAASRATASYYQQLAQAQDHRNETLVIGLVEAIGSLDVAVARMRQVRARVGMEQVVPPPPQL
jgi:hypothetical protein